MSNPSIQGLNILVVEDEFVIAMDLEELLREAGANVIGPAATVEQALGLLKTVTSIDSAILDVVIGTDRVDKVVDALNARNIPFVFVTACGERELPKSAGGMRRRFEKPLDPRVVDRELSLALQS